MRNFHFIFVFLACISFTQAQVFTHITDPYNPIVSDAGTGDYAGASWIDFDNDGLQDLFISNTGSIYRNIGNGNFEKVTGIFPMQGVARGNSWADVDNDGDLDCIVVGAGNTGTSLYINHGGQFFNHNAGIFSTATDIQGWTGAWADYDMDGYVDLIISAPFNFAGIHNPNILIHNDGNLNFSRVDTSIIVRAGVDTYTVPVWSDYDNDGDPDLFISAGPVNSLSPDYMYKNMLKETSVSYFNRITSTPISSDLQDGQLWNFIDYDNDGDLDVFITNYTGGNSGMENKLYRNEGGFFVQLGVAEAGDIVSDVNASLASIWEDFDNDGDLDCFITNDNGQQNAYYQNNLDAGSAIFTRIYTHPFCQNYGQHQGAAAADYDRDGDLDLFISGEGNAKGLYRNDTQNGNHWINLLLKGVNSNQSGIGAKVRLKANINDNPVWMMREVSTQNSFNGMSSLNVEFGLGDATVADSIIVEWPSGVKDIHVAVPADQYYDVIENASLLVGIADQNFGAGAISLEIFPNPVNNNSVVKWETEQDGDLLLELNDISGRSVIRKVIYAAENINHMKWDKLNADVELSRGVYVLSLMGRNSVMSTKILITE